MYYRRLRVNLPTPQEISHTFKDITMSWEHLGQKLSSQQIFQSRDRVLAYRKIKINKGYSSRSQATHS